MNYDQAIEYIHSVCWLGSRPGLSRIKLLCSLMGDPQDRLKFIHIAGTNGKGSTAAMLSSVLFESGLKVGTFTSPYVYRFNERISINSRPISDDELAEVVTFIKPLADQMADTPTEFELITAIGFEYFLRQGCDVVILEAGLGGRLDSTNIIKSSLLSIITGIALDHTDILGDTTAKIAYEKAGIIKEGCPVLYGSCDKDAAFVIEERADQLNSKVYRVPFENIHDLKLSLDSTTFSFPPLKSKIDLSLVGAYQPFNAATVITASTILGIDEAHITKGLKKAKWPARFEVLSKDPVIIFDGSHNPEGISATVKTVKELFPGKLNILTGVMRDKCYNEMALAIKEICENVYCTTPNNPRALDSMEYARSFTDIGCRSYSFDSTEKALLTAIESSRQSNTPLLVMGSLYLYSEFREALDKIMILKEGNLD